MDFDSCCIIPGSVFWVIPHSFWCCSWLLSSSDSSSELKDGYIKLAELILQYDIALLGRLFAHDIGHFNLSFSVFLVVKGEGFYRDQSELFVFFFARGNFVFVKFKEMFGLFFRYLAGDDFLYKLHELCLFYWIDERVLSMPWLFALPLPCHSKNISRTLRISHSSNFSKILLATLRRYYS
jgi:hypothetical protein